MVGFSLDGPEEMHDRFRLTRAGGGTWRAVIRRAGALAEGPGRVQCALRSQPGQRGANRANSTGSSGRWESSTSSTFRSPISTVSASRSPSTIRPEQYGRFLCETFDAWWPDRRRVHIRYFDNIAEALAGQKPGNCTMHETCDSYVVVEYNGDVYPCDFFVESSWKLGNVTWIPGRKLRAGSAATVRRQQDDSAPRLPGLRVRIDLPWRLPQAPPRPAPPLRRSRLLLRRLQDDLRKGGRPSRQEVQRLTGHPPILRA